MSIQAKAALAVVALLVSTQLATSKALDSNACCQHPGETKKLPFHAQDMRWETHGITPAPMGERHVIERTWELAD